MKKIPRTNQTIYAVMKPKRMMQIYAFKGAWQSEVENFLLWLGFNDRDYFLSLDIPEDKEDYSVLNVRIERTYRKGKYKGTKYSFGPY